MFNRPLTDHFTFNEISCNCSCGFEDYDIRLLGAMEHLRALAGRPIHINSWCRCQEYNKAEGGRPHSQHLLGRGVDCFATGMSPEELAQIAEQVPCFARGGIGIYEWGVHLDCRGYKARWKE